MKDNATTKPTKKKRLVFWLVLAACLLIVAAITVGVIFAVNGNGQNPVIDNQVQDKDNDDTKTPDTGNNDDDDDDDTPSVDTSSQYEFIVPIREVNLMKSHEFGYNRTMDWYCLHEAMDFSAPAGTEVLAAVDGTVKSVVKDDPLDYAVITIEHANGITTVYKFVEPAENLAAGSKVSRGQIIGAVAVASGVENADGEHLHFEVYKDGKIADPDDYLNITSK